MFCLFLRDAFFSSSFSNPTQLTPTNPPSQTTHKQKLKTTQKPKQKTGYIGHDQGGQLTEAVRRRPYSVVLFDEVEKAHPDVLNVLLQVLDDGRLTDSKGRVVSFRDVVIILTSNVGAQTLLQAAAGEISPSVAKQAVLDAAKRHFRPEFLNRLDDIIVFEPLTKQQLLFVAQALVGGLQARLAPRNISLRLTTGAIAFVVASAYDPQYGARPLRRWLEQHVVTDLARLVVSGQLPDGSDVVCDVSAAGVGGAGGGGAVVVEEDGGGGGGATATYSDGSGLVYRVTPKARGEGQAGEDGDGGAGARAGGRASTPRGAGGGGAFGGKRAFFESMNDGGAADDDDEEDEESMEA